ncbi:stage VI sporulation protein F [Paenibacillus assamensis]|uniref:stage VI sporulation protein F n=1 Tax=Paenibacillus assamensis TaxID=311244 RepID=UPI0003FE86E9|nr:stage VI sporulation protein F [Paenibacillus assamensis]
MSYQKYGISPQLVQRVKDKTRNPVVKDRLKQLFQGVTKADLQHTATVRKLLRQGAKIVNEPLSATQEEQFVQFIIAQKIDPNNTLHLLKLWTMFR